MKNDEQLDHLADKMAQQLRLKGDGLETLSHRAGRRVPKSLRADFDLLIEAESYGHHAKLARRIDPKRLEKARRRVEIWLDSQDPDAERWAAIQDTVARIAFIVFVTSLGALGFAYWQGAL